MARENIGIYYPEGKEHEIEEFDEVAYRFQDKRSYSRSQAVREAMKMHKMILETMEDLGWDISSPHERRNAVSFALREKDQREREEEKRLERDSDDS